MSFSFYSNEQIKNMLIKNAVRNLKEFGYPSVTAENIKSDFVYSEFFKNMLLSAKGQHGYSVDSVIDEILSEIDVELIK